MLTKFLYNVLHIYVTSLYQKSKTMSSGLIEQDKALEFMTAGNATFTIKSLKTGNRFTYKMELFKEDLFFVSVLTGNDNTKDYSHMLHIRLINGIYYMRSSKKGIDEKAVSRMAFSYVFSNLLIGRKMTNIEIWHEGHCCRCGRTLTVPESIASGIGPECSKIINKIKNQVYETF